MVFLDANVIVGPDGGIDRKHGGFFVHQSGPGLRACCLGTALATIGEWAASRHGRALKRGVAHGWKVQ